jgi:hypothetical protein
MRLVILILGLLLFSLTSSTAQLKGLLKSAKEAAGSLTDIKEGNTDGLDIAGGLKEALNKGVESAVTSLSAKDGYLDSPYKLLLPDDVKNVVRKLKVVPGFGDVEDKLIKKMNETAELAAKEATPIFVDAIKSITITDAKSILFGEDDAATSYLSAKSRTKLYDAFAPVIQKAMSTTGITKYWSSVVTKYNKLPLTKDVNPDLEDHVNNKSLDGLFGLISVKEEGIRSDVSQRTSPLLQDVFSKLD